MNNPNGFILGAAKCGTTALANYLGEHPQVYASPVKEPHYLSRTSLPVMNRLRNEEEYLQLFRKAGPEHRLRFEASTFSLYAPEAIPEILDRWPDARMVAMVRNPVDMAYSHHSQLRYHMYEDVEDFGAAWDLQEARARGERIPRYCPVPEMLQYRKVCSLGEQVERMVRLVPEAQRLLIFHDDMVADTPGQYRRVLEFFGLEDDQRTEFPRYNSNKTIQRRWLAQLGRKRPLWWNRATLRIYTRLGITPLNLSRKLTDRLCSRHTSRPRLDPDTRRSILAAYEEDIQRLEAATGRDLSAWRSAT